VSSDCSSDMLGVEYLEKLLVEELMVWSAGIMLDSFEKVIMIKIISLLIRGFGIYRCSY
jgi:hypothetical protein